MAINNPALHAEIRVTKPHASGHKLITCQGQEETHVQHGPDWSGVSEVCSSEELDIGRCQRQETGPGGKILPFNRVNLICLSRCLVCVTESVYV